jgi:uncharacterized membrane protein
LIDINRYRLIASSECRFVLDTVQWTKTTVSLSLTKVLALLNSSNRSGQKVQIATRISIEFETSSNRNQPLLVNNELRLLFVLDKVQWTTNTVSLPLTKLLVVLIHSKRLGQQLLSSIEFETSSDRSLPLAVNNELRVSVCLRYSAMDD